MAKAVQANTGPLPQGPEVVLGFEHALAMVRGHGERLPPPPVSEAVAVQAAHTRVLAEPVFADRDQPPFPRATRDGFALQADRFSSGEPLAVVGMVRAGEAWAGAPLTPGQAVQIMTGAPVPPGADSVAMVEHVTHRGGSVQAYGPRTLASGDHIVDRGSEARAGQTLLEAGTVLLAAELALAASCGYRELRVYRRPRVAIVATGDELVELDRQPLPHQIRNSNSYALAALVEAAGGEAVRLPIVPDTRPALAAGLRTAAECDLVLFSGGVSMGEYDLVEQVLRDAGAEFLFTGVRMQPGKPAVFGRLGGPGQATEGRPERGGYFFGLPGNPISTQVTFHCFAEPMLHALAGRRELGPRWVLARLAGPGEGKPGLTRLLPARMDGVEVRVTPWQGSGDLAANARANCYVELPGDHEAGDTVRVLLRHGG